MALDKDDLGWRRTLIEDDLGRKTTMEGRQPWIEDNHEYETTLDGDTLALGQPWMEEDLGWETTLEERKP